MAVDLPRPIKMEDTSLKTEVIDLDDYACPEEAVLRWHIKVRNQFKTLYGDENEDTLNNLMKWYIETLVEDSFEIEACRSFIKYMCKHIHFFHGYFKELNWTSVDNYLDNMEDILALYLDFECDLYTKNLKMEQNIGKNLLKNLKIYLMHKEERVFHVLLKIKLNSTSHKSQQFLDNLFKMVLGPVPINTSDVAFCRAYILHQRWKKVQNRPEIYKTIDDLLYKHYHQTPNAINTNPILKEILQPQNDSLLDILAHIMDNDKILCESYFNYVKKQRIQEDLIGDVSKIELDEFVTSSTCNLEDDREETTDTETVNVFENLPKVNSQKSKDCVVEDVVKMEDSDEDDCIIVGEGTIDCDPSETKIVYEILDDDDDIEAIIYFTAKEPTSNKPLPTKKSTRPAEEISFLSSIDIQEVNSNKENTNSNIRSQSISISPPSFKSQNFDNDSVKSREILSRKFTRKKVDNPIAEIIEDTENTFCIALDTNEWDKPHPNNNEPEEPSRIFEGLVTPPTSHDDQHGYERDFHNEHIENSCYNQNTNNKEMGNNCLTPHSTDFSNSDFCNNSTNVQEKVISESYASPTSPDISSTCEPCEYEQETSTSNRSVPGCTKDETISSDIQIGTIYSMKDFTETDPIDKNISLNDSTKENRFMNDSTEENCLTVESVDLNCSVLEDTYVDDVTNEENLMDDQEELDTFRSDSLSVLDVRENGKKQCTENNLQNNMITDNAVEKNIINSLVEEGNHVQSKNNNIVKEKIIAGDMLNLEISTNNCTNEKTIMNEHVNDNIFTRMNGEHFEDKVDNVLTKQLTVKVPRLDIETKKKMDVIFTSKQGIKKIENEVHLRYNELKGEHGLDDCFSGAIKKINCQENMVNHFDLFDDNDINSTMLNNANSTTSPCSIASPEYDGGFDDFRSYLVKYQETAKKPSTESPVTHLIDQAPKTNSNTNKNVLAPQLKRKRRIAFADGDVKTTSTRELIIHRSNQIQGILKKTTVQTPILIPREQMNLQSLTHFRVKPTDHFLQSYPCVVIEKLSEMEIKEWQRVSEKTRRKRVVKQKPTPPFSSTPSMTMFRVDYDKQTPLLSSVTVRYRAPEDQNWRSNTRDPKIEPHDEGNLAYNGRKNGKRKMLNQPVSSPQQARKRGRPRKKT